MVIKLPMQTLNSEAIVVELKGSVLEMRHSWHCSRYEQIPSRTDMICSIFFKSVGYNSKSWLINSVKSKSWNVLNYYKHISIIKLAVLGFEIGSVILSKTRNRIPSLFTFKERLSAKLCCVFNIMPLSYFLKLDSQYQDWMHL